MPFYNQNKQNSNQNGDYFINKAKNNLDLVLIKIDDQTYKIDPNQPNLDQKYIIFYVKGDEPFTNVKFKSKAGNDIEAYKLIFKNNTISLSGFPISISIPKFTLIESNTPNDKYNTNFLIVKPKNENELKDFQSLEIFNPGIINLKTFLETQKEFVLAKE